MKKLVSILLSVILILSFTVPCYAANTTEEPKPTLKECHNTVYSDEEIILISDDIVASTEFWPAEFPGGIISVWIALRITEHPQLANTHVFRETVIKLVDISKTMVEEPNDSTVILDYNRVGGELALHIALLMMFDLLSTLNINLPDADYWYDRFDYAEINYDEHRIPEFLMNWTGMLVMELLP